MAATFVGSATASAAGSTSDLTVAFNTLLDESGGAASLAQDDVVYVAVSIASASGSQGDIAMQDLSASGWLKIAELAETGATYITNLALYRKVMGASPDTSFTYPGGSGHAQDAITATVIAWRGLNTTTPEDVATVTASGTGTYVGNPGSITPSTSGAAVFAVSGGAAAATTTAITNPGSPYSTVTNHFRTVARTDTNDSALTQAVVHEGDWTSGAVDPPSFSGGTTGSSMTWAAFTVALRPASTGHNLSANGTTTSSPDLGTPALGQAHPLVVARDLQHNPDPGFDNAGSWTANAGWSVTGSKAVATAASNTTITRSDGALDNGRAYLISFDIANYGGTGNVRPEIGGNVGSIYTGNGTKTQIIVASSTDTIALRGSSSFSAEIDNFTVSGSGFATGSPVLGTPALGTPHSLTANSITGYGPELVANGDFAAGNTDGWTPSNATLSVVSGRMRVTATADVGYADYSVSVVNGQKYEAKIEGVSGTSNAWMWVGYEGGPYYSLVNAAPPQSIDVVFTSGITTLVFRATATPNGAYCDYDNVSLRTTAAPDIGTPSLGTIHSLTATGLATSAPALGTPSLGQKHVLTVNGVTTSAPVLGTPALAIVLVANGVTTSAPVLGTPALTVSSIDLVANNTTTSSPVTGTPALAQTQYLAANSTQTGSPALGAPALAQIHLLGASGLTTGPPSLGTPSLGVIRNLVANALTTAAPALGAPAATILPTVLVTVHPASVVSDGGWTDQLGGNAIPAALDETSPDDLDYAQSPPDPVDSVLRLKLASMNLTTVNRDVLLRYRLGRSGGAAYGQTVRFYQGNTLIGGPWTHDVSAPTTFEQSISPSLITDANDLYIEVEAN